jgi:hypothetical protein
MQPDRPGESPPPSRLVSLLRELQEAGVATTVRSILSPDLGPAMRGIASAIGPAVLEDALCTVRPLDLDAAGQAPCRFVETLATADEYPPGRVELGRDDEDRTICQICQRGDGVDRLVDADGNSVRSCAASQASGHYWEYLPGGPRCGRTGRVQFGGRALPLPGSMVNAQCLDRSCTPATASLAE